MRYFEIAESQGSEPPFVVNPRWSDVGKILRRPGSDRELRFFLFPETDLLLVWHGEDAVHWDIHDWLRKVDPDTLGQMGATGSFIGGSAVPQGYENGGSANVLLGATDPLSVHFLDYGNGEGQALLSQSDAFKRAMGSRRWRVTRDHSDGNFGSDGPTSVPKR
jgi:hypothetical protein